MPTFTIQQIACDKKRQIVKESDFDDLFEIRNKLDLSATNYMIEYCRSKNNNFQLLLNDPLFSSELTSKTYTNDRKNPIIESMLDFDKREMEKLQTNISFGRI